jgi:hypothetical protein
VTVLTIPALTPQQQHELDQRMRRVVVDTCRSCASAPASTLGGRCWPCTTTPKKKLKER